MLNVVKVFKQGATLNGSKFSRLGASLSFAIDDSERTKIRKDLVGS